MVVRYEDEVVTKLAAKLATKKMTPARVRLAVADIRIDKSLAGFDRDEVLRRIFAGEVNRPPRSKVNLEDGYVPSKKRNLAMLYVVTSSKLGFLAGRVQKILSGVAIAGSVVWLAATNGHDGGALTLTAAGILAAQFAIDVGRRNMIPEFTGIAERGEYMATALERVLSEAKDDDEVLLVVSELQARTLGVALAERGFVTDAYLPLVEDGKVMNLTR